MNFPVSKSFIPCSSSDCFSSFLLSIQTFQMQNRRERRLLYDHCSDEIEAETNSGTSALVVSKEGEQHAQMEATSVDVSDVEQSGANDAISRPCGSPEVTERPRKRRRDNEEDDFLKSSSTTTKKVKRWNDWKELYEDESEDSATEDITQVPNTQNKQIQSTQESDAIEDKLEHQTNQLAESEEYDNLQAVVHSTTHEKVNLSELLIEQEREISEKYMLEPMRRADIFRSKFSGRKNRGTRRFGESSSRSTKRSISMEEKWQVMIENVLGRWPDLFSSENSLLKERPIPTLKGCAGYIGLRVSQENCHDVREIYELKYKSREMMNVTGWTSYSLERSIIGQFLRWAIAASCLEVSNGWRKNALFSLMKNEQLVKCFVNYFIMMSSPSTVCSKCNTLLSVCKFARAQLSDEAESLRKIEHVMMFLNGTFNAAKAKGREKFRMNQCAEQRIQAQTIVTENQMKKGMKLAKNRLQDIIESFLELKRKNGRKKAIKNLNYNQALLDKWCLNFLALLALTGGGQRPQAYARLQCPDGAALEDLYSDEAVNMETVSIKTFREKTSRALDIPGVTFPAIILPYLRFHLKLIRPLIVKRRRRSSEGFDHDDPLLLHSRHGDYLTTTNVSHSIKLFMSGVESNLKSVTAMTLRASYATSMLHNFRSGKLDTNLSEERFLELVSKQMNTSVEQLRGTYAACYSSDFKETVKLVSKHFCVALCELEDDIELNGDNEQSVRSSDSNSVDDGDHSLYKVQSGDSAVLYEDHSS